MNSPESADQLRAALEAYATQITPWARSVASYMLADVARRNAREWKQHSRDVGIALRAEVEHAPTGALLQQLLAENVNLIRSIPEKAAKRVHEKTLEALTTGARADTIARDILATTHATAARAKLIARTEVARTANSLTMARALHVGSEGYIWRTVGDADVRDSHAEMEGKYILWAVTPKLSDGTITHAGMIYNCRCFAEPVLPDF